MIQEELSGKIIGAGMDVLNELRPGLDEKLYERAMIIELKRRGHTVSLAQMLGYLNITGLDLALLVNFKNARLEWKRVLRPQANDEQDTPDLHA